MLLKATIGSSFAALYAGKIPNTIPVSSETKNAIKIHLVEYTAGTNPIFPIIVIAMQPRIFN